MKIEEKTIIKYFDIVLLADKKDSFFGIYRILSEKHFKTETRDERDFLENLRYEIKEFSEFHGYFEFFPNGNCKLTEKGLKAKEKGGHLKYKKALTENPLDWYKIIPIILTIIFGLLNVYQKYDYNRLKNDYNYLNTQYDSLKVKLSDENNNMIVHIKKPLIDTLKTKSLNDLKTD